MAKEKTTSKKVVSDEPFYGSRAAPEIPGSIKGKLRPTGE